MARPVKPLEQGKKYDFMKLIKFFIICSYFFYVLPASAQEIKENNEGSNRVNGEVYNPDGIELIYVAGMGVGITEIQGFYIGKFEITQAQWRSVMGNNPSKFKGDNLPVERVSWEDTQEFISKLNVKTGRNYRLPKEFEWEYAARGGKTISFAYSGSSKINDVGWYTHNSRNRTHAVGTKQPNELGIHDMTGNVWEWCQDLYGRSGKRHVIRGCGWFSDKIFCHIAFSKSISSKISDVDIGFRVVLVIENESKNITEDVSENITEGNTQDVITLRNGDEIKAKVTEISSSEIRYKRLDNLAGPTIVISRAEVFAINYGNGTREVINPLNKTNKRQPANSTNKSQPANSTNRTSFEENSSQGVAFGVNALAGTGGDYTHVGIGAKFLYSAIEPFRIAGEFDFFPSQSSIKWWDFSLYGHYLMGSDQFKFYPSAGCGYVRATASEENFSASVSAFAFSVGCGIDIALTSNVVLNSELRFKFIRFNKEGYNIEGYRTNIAVGLAWKF